MFLTQSWFLFIYKNPVLLNVLMYKVNAGTINHYQRKHNVWWFLHNCWTSVISSSPCVMTSAKKLNIYPKKHDFLKSWTQIQPSNCYFQCCHASNSCTQGWNTFQVIWHLTDSKSYKYQTSNILPQVCWKSISADIKLITILSCILNIGFLKALRRLTKRHTLPLLQLFFNTQSTENDSFSFV